MTLLILLIGIAIVGFYFIGIYNRLVRLRNLVAEGWSGIDVQLKKRHDLIPNLVETIKGYTGYEQSTLQKVIEARNSALHANGVSATQAAENNLTGALRGVFALAEQYPDLKANQNFIQLQNTLNEVEGNLEQARRYYNGTVREFNTMIESFPSSLVANNFAFRQAEFFELENEAERNVPKVSF